MLIIAFRPELHHAVDFFLSPFARVVSGSLLSYYKRLFYAVEGYVNGSSSDHSHAQVYLLTNLPLTDGILVVAEV